MRILLITFLLFFLGFPSGAFGQQDPMYTQYMFNKLAFNPACAGSDDHLSFWLIHRQQWVGIEGAPVTQSFTAHTPLRNDNVGFGMSFTHDKAGPTEVFSVSTSYAYRFRLDSKGKSRLSIGLSAGLTDWHGDWFNVNLEQAGDPVYQTSFSSWAPNFGAGIYYYNQNFYAGIGCPKLLEYDLHKATNNDAAFGRSYRHYYTTAGYAFPVNASGSLVMKTSILLKTTGLFSHYQRDAVIETIGAPTALDLDAALFFYDTFWLGAGYRTALQRGISSDDSISFLAAVHLRDGLRFGFAYDLTLSKLRKISSGSIELLAGYEFDLKIKRVHSPRYF